MLQVDGLSAGYSKLPIIREVLMSSRESSIISIIGPNGSGKSTLLKAAIGLLKPMNGHVGLGDQDITGWPPHRSARAGVGYVPQTNSVFPSLTVIENLEMGAYARSEGVRERIDRVLAS